jgi:UDP-galactopyranose mutase
MNTFYQLWELRPGWSKEKIDSQKNGFSSETAQNLEEKAISLVGTDIYNTLIKGYWEAGKGC